MKKFKILITSLLFSIGVNNLNAQVDHLEPVGGIFDIYDFQFEYYSKVRKVLFNGLDNSPEVRFLVIPSFFVPENVLDIEYDREIGKYYLIHHICEKMLWNNEKWEEVKVDKYKKEITKNSVDIVKSLFEKAISKTRYSEVKTIKLDGTTYYFTVSDYGQKSGTVWSPSKGTLMRKLVDVGCEIIELVKNRDELIEFDKKLVEKIEKLKSEIE